MILVYLSHSIPLDVYLWPCTSGLLFLITTLESQNTATFYLPSSSPPPPASEDTMMNILSQAIVGIYKVLPSWEPLCICELNCNLDAQPVGAWSCND